ncbi:MAG TPA: SMC family ATPase, partial [Geminicoccaceae bacterium]|nr:SMC family ATPase [Geminicoccaceae bacterium]
MRPLRLVMRGFGAYAGEQALDFTLLGGDALFLIHGPTGAGKTTVLDAICFALYGETSGGERDGRQMRSDHATPEAPTEVVFDFALGECAYRVERSPDYDRPARRGGGTTTQRATACLWRLTGAGPGEVLAAKPQAVNERVRDLLGFKADQFRQVVVLPQGRFRQLLRADSQEREALMAVLFGTGALADLQERLKARSAELRREAEDWQRDRATLLGRADAEDEAVLAARRAGAVADLGAAVGRLDGLRAAEQAARIVLDAARAVQAKLAELADADAAVRTLEADAAAFGARERELALARRAAELEGGRAGLEQAERRARDAADEADRAERRHHEATLALDGALTRLAAEEDRGAEREMARTEVARLTALAERLPALFAARERHAAAEAAQRRATAERDGLERELGALAEAAEAAAAELGAAREAVARLDGLRLRAEELARARDDGLKLEAGRRDFATALAALADAEARETAARRHRDGLRGRLEDLERAWRAGQAGVLAEGAPCPVCGATHHPAPAARRAGVPGDAELDGARGEVSEAEAACEKLARVAAERGREVARLRSRVEAIEAG